MNTVSQRTRPGFLEVAVGGAAYIVGFAAAYVILHAVPDENGVLSGTIALFLAGALGLIAASVAIAIRIRKLSVFGFRRTSPKYILIGAALGIGSWIVGAALSLAYIAASGDAQTVQSGYQDAAAGGALGLLASIVFGGILTPLGEESFFRGVLTNALGRYSAWVAVLVSAAVFALAHGINPVLPAAFVVGLSTALMFRKSGSIWPGFAVHVMNNLTGIAVPLAVASLA